MDATIKLCDQCGAKINGNRLEMRYVLIQYRAGVPVEVFKRAELCGESCLHKANAALVREVREKTGQVAA